MKFLTILLSALTLLAVGAHGQTQPKVGTTQVVKSDSGLATNALTRGGQRYGGFNFMQTNYAGFNYTNTNPGITVSFTAGNPLWTLAGSTVQALQLREGDEVVEASGGAYQTTVLKIVDSTHFLTENYSPGITRVASPTFFILRGTIYATDIGGSVGALGFVLGADGSPIIFGAQNDNSARLKWFNSGRRAAMSMGYDFYGLNDSLTLRNSLGGGTAQGAVWAISTNATEGMYVITPDNRTQIGGNGLTNISQYWMPNMATGITAVASLGINAAGQFGKVPVPAGGFPLTADGNGNRFSISNLNSLALGYYQNLGSASSNYWISASRTNYQPGRVYFSQFSDPTESGSAEVDDLTIYDVTNSLGAYRRWQHVSMNSLAYSVSNIVMTNGAVIDWRRDGADGPDFHLSTRYGGAQLQFMTNWLRVTNGNTFTGPLFAGSVNVWTNLNVTNAIIGGASASFVNTIFLGNAMGANNLAAITTVANGDIRLTDSATTGFNKLQFGGVTAAFPSLGKTNGNFYVSDGAGNLANPTNNMRFPGSGSVMLPTNAAPTSVTIGVTAADKWFVIKDDAGVPHFVPGWLNH